MEVIYEDDSILVCYKPAGVPTQTKSVGQQDMVSQIATYRASKKEKPEVYVIHRLDQPVEGVMVFAKTKSAAASLTKQVTEHDFSKKYYCIIDNKELATSGELTDYLVKDAKSNMSRVCTKDTKGAKLARLFYNIIEEFDDKRLVDVELDTGRHHQIRVQFASRKSPLIGDTKYGGAKTGRNLALCSYHIGFKHPVTGKLMEYNISPKGADFSGSSIY